MPIERAVVLKAPDALRSCAADPAKPSPDDPYGIGRLIQEQAAALDDCQATLAERNAWEDAAAAQLESTNQPGE